MSIDTLTKFAERCGWSTETQLDLACQFILNNADPEDFQEFLQEEADSDSPMATVKCVRCRERVAADKVQYHIMGAVCDDCWDDRLYSTQ